MIIKGILKTIDYNNNSCTVRLPLFEASNSSGEVVLPAIFMNQPGMFNGYNEGDVVFVDFENNKLDSPIIIGKLYLGSEKEALNSHKSGLKVSSLTVDSNATLPLDTKLVFSHPSSEAPVDKGLASYKSIIDIIKALHTTEATLTEVTDTQNNTFIQKIEITYLSQPADLETPLANHEGWSLSVPASKDGYKIWQKTTTYNSKGQILGIPEIICISDLSGTASYWLKCSTKNHAGNQQSPNEAIEITAMIKLGLNVETEDADATLYYRWSGEEEISANGNKIVLTNDGDFKNKNIIIRAERNGITYLTETIIFSPLNTPILRFSKETDSLTYDSYGYNKINTTDAASVTATILLNDEVIPATFSWLLEDCTNQSNRPTTPSWDPIEVSGDTLTIYHISEAADRATATCTATYTDNAGNQQTITKVFSVIKSRQGKSLYKLDILNEFSTIPLTYDDTYADANLAFTEHTVTAFYGDEILTFSVSTELPQIFENKKYYLHIKQVNGLTLETQNSIDTSSFTTKVNTITADAGEVIYELYRGNTKVASAKFELSVLRSGTPATNLWVVISHPVHTGAQQENTITIQPKIQIGNGGIDNNHTSTVWYSYTDENNYTQLVWDTEKQLFEIPFLIDEEGNKIGYRNQNIKIIASQTSNLSDAYEEEEITYSPLNTPIIDLTNDSDDLVYTPGGTKIDDTEVATSTASLWLNGEKMTADTFIWEFNNCNGTYSVSQNKQDATVIITALTAAKGIATCTATYRNKTYTKVFSIAKQIQGDASTSYWLKLSNVVHTGTAQEKPIEAIAMKKEGNMTERVDDTATLYFRYASEPVWTSTATTSKCTINSYKDEDLYIVAVHGNYIPDATTTEQSTDIYDWETITYSPLNTPVIDLENDRGTISYNDQDQKVLENETTSTTANLYLNGKPVAAATYTWEYTAGDYTLSNNNKTIVINSINENINKAEAICRATYKGNTYTKAFTIIKNINSVSYWLKTSSKIHTGESSINALEITAMRKEGTSPETPDTTAYLWYKFSSSENWIKETDGSTHLINIPVSALKNEDLLIIATHNSSDTLPPNKDWYDQETITYSPKNTPVIDLTNDSDILPYDADGYIIGNPIATTTAELYLNGEKINEAGLIFNWTDATKDSSGNSISAITFDGETNTPTIKVKAISENTATATCTITVPVDGFSGLFANKTYSKDFKIARQIKGDPTTLYKIVSSTATVTYTKANAYVPAQININVLESRGTKEASIIDISNTAGLELLTNQNGLEFTKNGTTYSLSSSDIIWPLEVRLVKDNVIIHKETINKVTDGLDGSDAVSPYTISLFNDEVKILTESPFVDTNPTWWESNTLHTIKVSQGITPISLENITFKAGPYTEASTDKSVVVTYQTTNISISDVIVIPAADLTALEQGIYIRGLADPTKLSGKVTYTLYVNKVAVGEATFNFLNILYGTDGVSITGVNNYYLATATESPAPTWDTEGWKPTLGELSNKFDTTNKYLWNYEEIIYSDTTTSKTTPEILSYYAKDGIAGDEGRGIESITEYYQINNTTTLTKPSSSDLTETNNWFTTPPVLTATAPYLWNVEKVVYTKGEPLVVVTNPVLIGTYSRSITGVNNKYLANADDKTIPSKTDSSWKTNIKDTGYGNDKPYLWNYEIVSYDRADEEGKTTTETTPELISYYAQDGKGVTGIFEFYKTTNSTAEDTPTWDKNTQTLDKDWVDTITQPNALTPYLWNVEVITYTDGTHHQTLPAIIGTYGETFGVNIIPSASSVIATETITENISSWAYSPADIHIKFTEVAGTTVIDCGDSKKRKYRYNIYVNNETTPQNTVELDSLTKTATIILPSTEVQRYRIELELKQDDNTWINVDTESISVARNGRNGADGADGKDAIYYWIKGVEAVHTGANQTDTISVTAMKRVGNEPEHVDSGTNGAVIWYNNNGTWKSRLGGANAADCHTLNFLAGEFYNDFDLKLILTHNKDWTPTANVTATDPNVEDWEVITYSPLNSPILSLTNDSASIAYRTDGTKVTDGDTVSTTAELYLNGSKITSDVSYSWNLLGCKDSNGATTVNTATVTIKELLQNSATATCVATYKSQTYTKIFTITKQLQGDKGDDGDNISVRVENAFYATTSYEDEPQGIPINPDENDTLETKAWVILNSYPTEDEMKEGNYKIVFHSSRIINWNEDTDSPVGEYQAWSLPIMYWCENPKAYNIIKTAKGLFGYGQGVYYTVDKTVTFNNKEFTAGNKYTPEDLAAYAAESEDNRNNVKVYINAEYIKTGAFTVKKDIDEDGEEEILFEAGLDSGTVKIGGFEVTDTYLTAKQETSDKLAIDYIERSFDEKVIKENGIDDFSSISTAINVTTVFIHNPDDYEIMELSEETWNKFYSQYKDVIAGKPWLEYQNHICIYADTINGESDIWDRYSWNSITTKWDKDSTQLKTNIITKSIAEVHVGTDKIEVTNGDKVVRLQSGALYANHANISGTINATEGTIGELTLSEGGLLSQRKLEGNTIPLILWDTAEYSELDIYPTSNLVATNNIIVNSNSNSLSSWEVVQTYYEDPDPNTAVADITTPTAEEQQAVLNLYLVVKTGSTPSKEYHYKFVKTISTIKTTDGEAEEILVDIWQRKSILSVPAEYAVIATESFVLSHDYLTTAKLTPEELFIGFDDTATTNSSLNCDYWPALPISLLKEIAGDTENGVWYNKVFAPSTTTNGTPWSTNDIKFNIDDNLFISEDGKLTLKLIHTVYTSTSTSTGVVKDPIIQRPSSDLHFSQITYVYEGPDLSGTTNITPAPDYGSIIKPTIKTETKPVDYTVYFTIKNISDSSIKWVSNDGKTEITTKRMITLPEAHQYKDAAGNTVTELPLVVKPPKKDSYVQATNSGSLTATNASISGTLNANAGQVGCFKIYETGLYSDFIELNDKNLIFSGGTLNIQTASGNNNLTLSAATTSPFIEFSNGGRISDNNESVGFVFYSEDTTTENTTQISYKPYIYATGTDGWGGTNQITVTIKALIGGVWEVAALKKSKTFTIYHKGYDNLKHTTRSVTITLEEGQYTKTISFGGYWSFYGASWNANGHKVGENDGQFQKGVDLEGPEFKQTESHNSILYSLGSILPREVVNSGTITVYFNTGYGSPVNTYRYDGTKTFGDETYYAWTGNFSATGHPNVYYTIEDPSGLKEKSSSELQNIKLYIEISSGDKTTLQEVWVKNSRYISSMTSNKSNCSLGGTNHPWTEIHGAEIHGTKIYGTINPDDSDKRIKSNISNNISKYDNLFDSLKPACYSITKLNDNKTHLGFIAQDIEQSLLENNLSRKDFGGLVISGKGYDEETDTITNYDETSYGIAYAELHALEVRQIQLLKQRVKELEEKVEQLIKTK